MQSMRSAGWVKEILILSVCVGFQFAMLHAHKQLKLPSLARWELIPDRLLGADKNLPANSRTRQHAAIDLPDFDGSSLLHCHRRCPCYGTRSVLECYKVVPATVVPATRLTACLVA